ncbi:MAG: leucyl/phenylalanyl-tRNA--protein transferase [Phycisphaeraceae bacterium]|nr:leucyl/phenylalanyl-tRNA--protein transferase [Phycisphaeraceae bacterium]
MPITPDMLVWAYSHGVFPMADSAAGSIHWYCPDPRGVIPLDCFHVPHSLQRRVRSGAFHVSFDQAFEAVIQSCALPRSTQLDTWISHEIIEAYVHLHDLGLAHSVEAWTDQAQATIPSEPDADCVRNGLRLVGGLYGVGLGGAFFGESMFSRATDSSKVCLVHLVDHLRDRGHRLLDTQYVTEHLRQFGAIEIPRDRYLALLRQALRVETRF